jgi:hypothetical protein
LSGLISYLLEGQKFGNAKLAQTLSLRTEQMSASGQKRKLLSLNGMSVLPSGADIDSRISDVGFVRWAQPVDATL